MVAARLTLLSLAAFSSGMFGAFRGAPRSGRLERRLDAPVNGTLSNATTTTTSGSALAPGSSSSLLLEGNSSEGSPLTSSASSSSAVSVPPTPSSSPSSSETHYQANNANTNAAPAPAPAANTRKAPPAIPTRRTDATQATTTTSVDFSRTQQQPPSEPTTTLASSTSSSASSATSATVTEVIGGWPPQSPEDYLRSGFSGSGLLAGWSSTRGVVSAWDWGDAPIPTNIEWSQTPDTFIYTPGPNTATFADWPISICQESDYYKTSTVYSVTHTSTVTWTEDPALYTPPYPSLSLPGPSCYTRAGRNGDAGDPARMTMSRCTSTGTDPKYKACDTTVYTISVEPKTSAETGIIHFIPPPVTFVTTDKNPAVTFVGRTTDMGQNLGSPTTRLNIKESPGPTPPVVNNGADPVPAGGPPVTVSVRPGLVAINDQTFTDSPVMPTQTVRIGDEFFTIDPTKVVGAGATVLRPVATGSAQTTGMSSFAPQSTTVGGVPVSVSGRAVVIDGTSFSLDAPATTKVVGDRTVSIGSDGIAVATGGSNAVPARLTPGIPPAGNPLQTEVVVAGGDLVTAVGQSVVVIRSTTITYGPAVPAMTTEVNGEAVVIGPGGVTVRGSVLGGPSASLTGTAYEIVGGATITQVAPSLVIIRGSTYTVGPGATATTVVIGRETVVIGPSGVSVSSLSFYYPFGPMAATTITPGPTAAAATASPTDHTGGNDSGSGSGGGGNGDSKKDAAAGLRPSGFVLTILVSSFVAMLSLWFI